MRIKIIKGDRERTCQEEDFGYFKKQGWKKIEKPKPPVKEKDEK